MYFLLCRYSVALSSAALKKASHEFDGGHRYKRLLSMSAANSNERNKVASTSHMLRKKHIPGRGVSSTARSHHQPSDVEADGKLECNTTQGEKLYVAV